MKIYLIVSLDTECDKGPNWQVKQPLGYTNILEGVPDRLQPIFEKYSIKPTYLLSPEIIKDDACVSLFRSLGNRVELGTHMHAEFIEPQSDMQTEWTHLCQSSLPEGIELEKMRNLTFLFKEKLGKRPLSFRAGCFGISRHTQTILEKLDYRVDSSVRPYWWRVRPDGASHNFLGSPIQPYHPSYNGDFRKQGTMRLLEVPVTQINTFWDKFPVSLLLAINPLNKYQNFVLKKFLKKKIKSSRLRPTSSTAEEMFAISEYIRGKVNGRTIILCMYFHSNEATTGTSPYFGSEAEVNGFIERMDNYFQILFDSSDVYSIGLSETAALRY